MKRKFFYILMAALLTSSCSMPSAVTNPFSDPEEILQEALQNMQQLETMSTLGEAKLEGNLLGTTFYYQMNNESQSRQENGVTVEAYTNMKMEGTGLPQTSDHVYFSYRKFGTYDSSSNTWSYSEFSEEDQFYMDLFLTTFDPTNSINQYYNSKIEQELEIVGNERINLVPCIGMSVKMNADAMMGELKPIFKAFAGSEGTLATTITGALVKNMELTYWIGKEDGFVHQVDTVLPTPFGDYTNTLTIYDYNAEFVEP
jgi:hypothetical protein